MFWFSLFLSISPDSMQKNVDAHSAASHTDAQICMCGKVAK